MGYDPRSRDRYRQNPYREDLYNQDPSSEVGGLGGAAGGGCLMFVVFPPLFLITMLIGLIALFGWILYAIAWLAIKGFYEVQTESDEVPRWFGVLPHPMWNAYTRSSGRTWLVVPTSFSGWGVLLMCFAIGCCIAGIIELIAIAL